MRHDDPTSDPLRVPPPDPRALAALAREGLGDLFHERQHRACTLVERYALDLACSIAAALGLPERLATPHSPAELLAACRFAPAFAPALHWLLDVLAQRGVLRREARGYVRGAPLPPLALDSLRAAGLAVDSSYEPAYALLDEAAALYPRVARGETVAERALLLRVRLWQAYFSNRNGFYALGNHVAARAAARCLVDGGGGPVLEVGAGLGSAAEALLETLEARGLLARLGVYVMTEPAALFRRRAEEAIGRRWPGLRIAGGSLDVNGPWPAADTLPEGPFALVWGVNVFHLARDLGATLAAARDVLRPGGWLVIGEGLRPRSGEPVGAELPFRLLQSYGDVRLDPARRPTPGFLTAAAWRAALADTGFEAVHLLPDAERLSAYYSGFLAAAVCGRRPTP